MQFARPFVLTTALLSLGAYATPGPILAESVVTLRTGLGHAKEQSLLAFDSANDTALQIDVDRILSGPAANLREDDFPLAIAPDDRIRWANAFNILDG
jgi:hypothetical protein